MKAPIHTYQLLVLRNQLAPLEVNASCMEDACQITKNNFSGDNYGLIEPDMVSNIKNTWLIMRTTPYEYCDVLHIYSWDGELCKSFGKTEVGNDIFSAIQKIAPAFFWQLDSDEQVVNAPAANDNIKNHSIL